MNRWVEPLAELTVRFGANVQPGQVVSLHSEPGKEELARAVASAAYRAGALFVDLSVFDLHVKRARLLHADPETLSYVPPWYGAARMAVAEGGGSLIALAGPVAPGLMDGIDAELLGRDMLPRLRESSEVTARRLTNWTVAPCPTPGWAAIVHPELEPEAGLARLWDEIAHICRLDAADPVAEWERRLSALRSALEKMNELALDELVFEGPGTSLRVGLLPGGQWIGGPLQTAAGIVHVPNIPTEEIFTSPDPERVFGYVRSTKPLVTSGTVIRDLEVHFSGGRVSDVRASAGAGTFRAITERDAGAARVGEVALVDREGRIGPLGTVFYETLLDENAASHIAIGAGFDFLAPPSGGVNQSDVHVDFMIGSNDVAVTGVRPGGGEVPLLRDGRWQI